MTCAESSQPQCLGHLQDAIGGRRAEGGAHRIAVVVFAEPGDRHFIEAGEAGLQPAQRLLQAFLEGASDRHDLTDRFHGGGEERFGAGELLESEARDFGHHVVDSRFERRRRDAAGNVVRQFVERVANGQPGGDLGDRKTGGLRGQGRGSRYARIHLDDHEAAVEPD